MKIPTLKWRVEWVFPQANLPVELYEPNVSSDVSLLDMIRKYVTDNIQQEQQTTGR